MSEKIEELVGSALKAAQADGSLPAFEVEDLGVERPNDVDHGDWTTTLPLRTAKLAHMAPRAIADALVAHLPSDPAVERVEVAGPGFVNFYLSPAASNEIFREAIEQGEDFGRSNYGNNLKIQVEYVSANPVGPLHVGHGRWIALGNSLCRVFEHAGYDVEPEYYINDHGSQMDVFGSSLSVRYMQLDQIMKERGCSLDEAYEELVADRDAYALDEEDEHPEEHPFMDAFNEELGGNAYGGTYIIDIAKRFWEMDGDKLTKLSAEDRMVDLRERGYHMMLDLIRESCHRARCDFDVWFSERSLYEPDETGKSLVERSFEKLDEAGYLYTTDDGALWFRSTEFGDDKDRVLKKSNGEYTYFASDVAYHWNKFQRVDYVIDIWGADHHGYIDRVRASCDAFGYPGQFEVLLGQFVNLLRNGHPVRMSKRKGTMITFDELVDEVGVDAVRYTLVSKSSNQTIDFDIEAAKSHAMSNPVYYVQYAHARICSILRKAAGVDVATAAERGMDDIAASVVGTDYDLSLLTDPTEEALARKLSEFGELIEGCARDRAPFRLTHYAEELAADFHAFYAACKVLPGPDHDVSPELSHARLAACDAVRRVLALTLKLVGVSAPQEM
jgi:arginyl-tRNA synthetase